MKAIFNARENPFVLLLFTTIGVLITLAFRPIAGVDFQDKVMFGIAADSMISIIPLFLLSFWVLYLLTHNFLYSMTFTWLHVLVTVITVLLFVTVLYIAVASSPFLSDRHELIGDVIQMLFIIFVGGQLLYLANVVLGLLRRPG